MSKFTAAAKRFGGFLKRNAFYFLIILCIASVAAVIALAVTRNNGAVGADNDLSINDEPVINPGENNTPVDNDPPVVNPPVDDKPQYVLTFITPCNGSIKNGYSDSQLVWNQSMAQFETHEAIDYVSSDLNVYASADGTVKETGQSDLEGYYIVIAHDEGYETKYLSLEGESTLGKGASVKQGQLIGKMSTSQGQESLEEAHLHFEMTKNGESINPLEVLVLDEK